MDKPFDVMLPFSSGRILGMGAEANGSFCIFEEGRAHVSRNYGNLSYADNMQRFKDALFAALKDDGGVDAVACDLHPRYATRDIAEDISRESSCEVFYVQHHVAHVFSCALENGITGDFAGIACDGTGYGTDGRIWGGEVFVSDRRAGSLEEQMMVGGESAIIYPSKMLFGILHRFLSNEEIARLKLFDEKDCLLLSRQADSGFNVFMTTSTGRVLDAVSSMLGICRRRTYDGEPAILLEKHAEGARPYELEPVLHKKDRWILDTTRLFEFVYENIDKDRGRLAATAHDYIASGLIEIAGKFRKKTVFSGGVARNSIISGRMLRGGVKLNKKVDCGDYGVCFGQCAYAAMKL